MELTTLLGWSLFGLIFVLIWQKVAPPKWRLGFGAQGDSHHISIFTALFAILLTITVIFFFNQIWNDLEKLVDPASSSRSSRNYYPPPSFLGLDMQASLDLQKLFLHTAFVIPVLVTALLGFLFLYRRGTAYAAVTLPYFIGGIAITLRLLYDAGSWAIRYHQRFGIYIVLGLLLVVFTALIFFVQDWWQKQRREEEEEEMKAPL